MCNLTTEKMERIARNIVFVLLLCLALAMPVSAQVSAQLPLRADEQVLQQYEIKFWQYLNEARRQPLAAAARLEIPEEVVRTVFAGQEWILEQGLAPLALNARLRESSGAHGRDMLTRLFYDYTTPEGVTFDERITATEYHPQYTGETLNALFFESFVSVNDAFHSLADALIRDELTGNTYVQRNIFNPELTEVGTAFFAQTVNLIRGLPFVYMVVIDFAAPVDLRPLLVGEFDADSRLLVRPFGEMEWHAVAVPAPGLFQYELPLDRVGVEVVTITANGLGEIDQYGVVYLDGSAQNYYIDLRPVLLEGEEL